MKTINTLVLLLISLTMLAQTETLDIEKGKQLTIKNACTACHQEYGPLLAPGFSGIGVINRKAENDQANIAISEAIAKGSKGQYSHFKDAVMPPYAQLPEDDRLLIANYILSLSNKHKPK